MKILFCTTELQYSNSSAAIRNRILLSGLKRFSQLDVLEFPQSLTKDNDCGHLFDKLILIDDFQKKDGKNENKNVLSKVKDIFKRLLKPYIPDSLFLKKISLKNKVDFNLYDLVISSSEPKGLHKIIECNIVRYKIKEFSYVQYWGDPWFDDISRPTNIITKILEKRLISKADFLIYNSLLTLKRQRNLFVNEADKMLYLPRGLDLSSFNQPKVIKSLSSNFSLLYAGDFRSNYRTIQNLVNACSDLEITLYLAGNGDFNKVGVDKCVQELGRLSTDALLKIRERSDFEVVIMNSRGGQLPGKVFDVMTSDKPVILILDGDFSIQDIPCHNRFILVKNNEFEIFNLLSRIEEIVAQFEFDFNELKRFSIDSLVEEVLSDIKIRK